MMAQHGNCSYKRLLYVHYHLPVDYLANTLLMMRLSHDWCYFM